MLVMCWKEVVYSFKIWKTEFHVFLMFLGAANVTVTLIRAVIDPGRMDMLANLIPLNKYACRFDHPTTWISGIIPSPHN